MKKIYTLFLFLLLTNISIAQTSKKLLGEWVFKEAYDKKNIDEVGLLMLQTEIINKMTFNFSEDQSFYGFAMGEIVTGTWKVNNEENKVTLKTLDGSLEFEILKLTETELGLKIGLGSFLMKKIL